MDTLQKLAGLPILSDEDCVEKLTDTDYYSYADTEELGRRHADMLCAGGEPGEDACQVAADT